MVNMITALCGYFSGTFVSDIGGTFEVILSFLYDKLIYSDPRLFSKTIFDSFV